jgi:pathogenesis-related protein 1
VVWHDSTLIGCARVECDNDLGVFITCNYYPPGNWDNQRPYLAARSAA